MDEKRIEAACGEAIERADAKFVESRTGFSIDGVPPLAHAEDTKTFVNEDLFRHREVWAAGHTHAVLALSPDEPARMTGGEVVAVG